MRYVASTRPCASSSIYEPSHHADATQPAIWDMSPVLGAVCRWDDFEIQMQ